MIAKILAYLVRETNLVESEREKSTEFVDRMCQITLEVLWTEHLREEEGCERTDSILEGLGAEWTGSFLAKIYPGLSRSLIRELIKAITELSIVVILELFLTFRSKNFRKGSAVLLTEEYRISDWTDI